MSHPPADDDRRHLAAILRAKEQGFTPVPLLSADLVVCERRSGGVVDVYSLEDIDDARAARWRACDYGVPGARPLWETTGPVDTVINLLLDLPPDPAAAPGEPAAEPPTSTSPRDRDGDQ